MVEINLILSGILIIFIPLKTYLNRLFSIKVCPSRLKLISFIFSLLSYNNFIKSISISVLFG